MTTHSKVLILGAGTGGISVAARLKRILGADQVSIMDPSENHYYQPLWTLVGAGVVDKESTGRPMESLIPKGVRWIREAVGEIRSPERKVVSASGVEYTYDYLVVATGLKLDFNKIKGVEGHLGTN
ncbi:MAG: FAD-dependent oxidoreductase, partial [Bdellovibrionota bacterium]